MSPTFASFGENVLYISITWCTTLSRGSSTMES